MKEYGKKHWMKFIGVGLASVLLSAAMVGVSIVLQYAIDFTMEGRVFLSGFVCRALWGEKRGICLT